MKTSARIQELTALYAAFNDLKMGRPFSAKFGATCAVTGSPIARGDLIRMLEGRPVSQAGVEVLSIIERCGRLHAQIGSELEESDLVNGLKFFVVAPNGTAKTYTVSKGKLNSQSLAAFTSRVRPLVIVREARL